jgi:Restriction endonuclease NotI
MSGEKRDIIGEILGEPAQRMRNPANAEYRCPFVNSTCIKRSQSISGSYPICSIWRRPTKGMPARLVCVCPKRFFEIDLVRDVVANCWPGIAPANPQLVHEIKMESFGTVDCVVADIDKQGRVGQFVSVELQAIDITGSVYSAYSAHIGNRINEERVSYNFNFANVYKRFITQLIAKGFYHHHWGTKVVAVVQDVVYEYFQSRTPFAPTDIKDSNIVFLIYEYREDTDDPGRYTLALRESVGTHHSLLQNAVLYKTPPSRDSFCERISAQVRQRHG